MALPNLFRDAVSAAHEGDTKTARQLLQEFLLGAPRHELGWLWLSKVSPDFDEQIDALQRVLNINPENTEAEQALIAIRTARRKNPYKEAVRLYRHGNSEQAHQILRRLVTQNPTHEKAWIGLSLLSTQLEEQIVTLEQAIALNPENAPAQDRLDKLIKQQPNLFLLAEQYEAYTQHDSAWALYQKIRKQSPDKPARKKAKEELNRLKQVKRSDRPITVASDNGTLIRLSIGPIIVYLLLILIHSGLRPLHISPVLLLGLLGVSLGSVMVVGAANTPHHSFWQSLLGMEGIADSPTRLILTVLGVLLMSIPFITVFWASYGRLLQFEQLLFYP